MLAPLLLALSSALSAAPQAPTAGELPPAPLGDDVFFGPPYRSLFRSLYQGQAPGRLRRGLQSGKIPLPQWADRAIWVEWEASALNQGSEPIGGIRWSERGLWISPNLVPAGGDVWRFAEQSFPVEFRPTAVCALGDDGLLVAGLDAEGAAVLELWSLRWPDPMPGPAADPVSGYRAVEVAFPELDEVRRIPVDALAVQGGVHGLIELAGPPELGPRALVRHGARGEIHTLDLASGGLTLLASADAPGGRLGEIAELADSRLRFLRAGVHRSAGQAYVLGPPPAFCARGAASHRYLVLLDGDRDGQLDLHVVLCRATYLAEGWHVLAQQVPLERR